MTYNSIQIIVFQLIISITIIELSKRLGFLDVPNNRKSHKQPTPYTGGVVLSVVFLYIVFLTDYEQKDLNLTLSYLSLAAAAGFIDDKFQVNPGTKIILQSIPIFLLIDNNIYLHDLGSYQGFGTLSLGSFDKIFTLFACLFLINSSNYSDGIDGLLTLITFLIIISFSFYLFFFKHIQLDYLLIISVPFAMFFFFNLSNGKFKVFLGDSGSNLIGYLLSFLSIILYNEYKLHPAVIIWPLAYLVYEFLSVNILRILLDTKIFKPGYDHLHYELKKILKTSNLVILFIIIKINLILSCIGFLINHFLNYKLSLLFFVILFFIYLYLKLIINKKLNPGK